VADVRCIGSGRAGGRVVSATVSGGSEPHIDLSGRVALVTGAGRAIGAEIARTLAACGAAVAVNDLHVELAEQVAHEITATGGRAVAAPADVTDRAAVEAMVDRVTAALGAVDIVVNNAGIPTGGVSLTRFRDLDPDTWDPIVKVNLYAVLYTAKATVDSMCERGWGRIITIASEAGRVGMPQGLSVYGAAKAGAIGFSRNLATEVGRFGVTVNCVSLGVIENQPARDPVIKATPVRRLGRMSEVAATVAFLASDHAAFITGQTLPVNGGVHTN
jgi:NAD(P)-dependent dehydrogenase (short-subunit alcohol dehydrogenase family)